MTTRSNIRSFPTMADMVKREEEIRRATARAEARQNHDFSQAGGLDGARRYTLAVHKWQQEQVKQDLHNIKTAYKRSNMLTSQNPEGLKYVDPQVAEDLKEQEFVLPKREGSGKGAPKNYGRNFFGYKSQPGSNKPHFEQMRAIKDKYSNVKNYYEYKGPRQMDKETREKLRKQKMANMSVQERVKSFAVPARPKVAGYQAPVDTGDIETQMAFDETSNVNDVKKPNGKSDAEQKREPANHDMSKLPHPSVDGHAIRPKSTEFSQHTSDEKEQKCKQSEATLELREEIDAGKTSSPTVEPISARVSTVASSSPSSSRRNFDRGSTVGSTMTLPMYRTAKPKTALDLVFDADTYAPDGRLRTVHTLPEFEKSFKEARQARYVRTKYKRDVEKELSVNQIFGR